MYVRIGLRWGGGWAGSIWAGECEVGAEAWGLGDGKRGAAAAAMGARATDGDGSETGADADDEADVTCGGIEEETTGATGMVGECIGT